MATPIRIKRSAVSGKRPQLTDLQVGELALNTYDGSLFTERDTGGVGIATTVSNLTPWTESYGASSISYLNSVGIGSLIPTAKLDVLGQTNLEDVSIVGNSTITSSGSGTGKLRIQGAVQGTKIHLHRASTDSVVIRYQNNFGNIYAGLRNGFSSDQRFAISNTGTLGNDPIFQASKNYNVIIGDSITLSGNTGNATYAGIITATGADINGDVNVAGVSTFSDTTFAGNIDANGDLDVDGHTELDNLNVSGVSTFVGNAQFDGNVSIGGTLTYEDVTNIDSIGIVTAGKGVRVTSGGLVVAGISTFSDSVRIGDNASITANVNADNLVLGETSGNHGITILSGQNATGQLFFGDSANSSAAGIQYFHTDNHMEFRVAGNERVRFTSGGFVGIGTEAPSHKLEVVGGSLLKGNLNVTGVSTFADDIFVGTGATVGFGSTAYFEQRVHIADDQPFHIGKTKSLQTVYNSQYDIIFATNTASQYILGSDGITLQNLAGQKFIKASATNTGLYHVGTQKLRTSTDGIQVVNNASGSLGTMTALDVNTSFLNVSGNSVFSDISTFTDIDVDGHTELDNVNISGVVTATNFTITSTGQVNFGGNLSQQSFPVQITTVHANEKISFYRAQHDDLSDEGAGIALSRKDTGSELASGMFSHSNGGLGVAAIQDIVFLTGGGSGIQQTDEALRITSTGNVGIGSNNPETRLDVIHSSAGRTWTPLSSVVSMFERNGGSVITLVSGNSANCGIDFADSNDDNRGFIRYDHSDDSMFFRVDGGERLRITSDGNVGISSTSPTHKLEVVGGSLLKGNLDVAGIATLGSGASGYAELFYQGVKKLETESWGTRTSGTVQALGGNLQQYQSSANSTGNILLTNQTGNAFQIGHTSSNSFITGHVGNISINAPQVSISTNFSVGGISTFSDTVKIGTGVTALTNGNVSIGGTFEIFESSGIANKNFSEFKLSTFSIGQHNNVGTMKIMNNNATGTLLIGAGGGGGYGGISLFNKNLNARYLQAHNEGAVDLYYDGDLRFSTSGIGATVYGQLDTTDLNVTGISTFDDIRVGEWSHANDYAGVFHKNQSGQEYMILSRDQHTFISATTGYDAVIRGGGNDATNQIRVQPASGGIYVTGDTTFNNNINVSGNVSVGGTLTYEDVTNIDSVGIITAQSGIHVTSGKVGIGTTNPVQRLEVIGGIRSFDSANSYVEITPTGSIELKRSGGAFIDFATSNLEDFDCRIKQESDGLIFLTGGQGSSTEKLRITSTGNFGIGNNNPQTVLDVSTTTQGEVARFRASDNARYLKISSFNAQFDGSGYDFNATSTGGALRFSITSEEKLRITKDGNVGIGTADPDQTLHVFHSTANNIALFESGDAFAAMGLSDSNGSVSFLTTLGALRIGVDGDAGTPGTNSTLAMTIKNDGNVGIGTDNPIATNALAGNTATLAVGILTANTIYGNVVGGLSPTGNIFIGGDLDVDGNTDLDVLNVSDTATFTSNLIANGNVGIGTNNPLQKLHVADGTSANIYIETKKSDTGSTAGLYYKTSSSAASDFFKTGIVLEDDGTSHARGKLHILQNNTADGSNATLSDSVVTFTQDGKVGIGTSNPLSLLSLYSDAADTELLHFDMGSVADRRGWKFIQGSTGTGSELRLRADVDNKHFKVLSANNTEMFRVNAKASGGYVYIPVNLLINDSIFHSGDDDTRIRFPDANTFSIETNGSERLRIISDGSVGIGTDAPKQQLEVYSGSAGRPTFRHSGGFGGVQIAGPQNASGASLMFTRGYDVVGGGTTTYSLFLNGSTQSLHFVSGDPSEYQTKTRLLLNSSGKIGIGTINPQAPLHIHDSGPGIRLSDSGNAGNPYAFAYFDANAANAIIHADKGNEVNDSRVAFAVDNSEKVRITSSGSLFVGVTTTSNHEKFVVDGNSKITGNLDVGGNVSIAGTLTYEDVTNVDSIGIITARDKIELTAAEGQIEATGSTGLTLNASDGSAYARIRVAGDTRLHITSTGTVGVNCTPTAAPLEVKQLSADGGALRLRDSSAQYRYLEFDVTGANSTITARSNNSHGNINIGTLDQFGRTTQLYIKGGANAAVGIGTDNPSAQLHIGPRDGDSTPHLYLASANNLYGFRIDTDDLLGGNVPLRIYSRFNGTDTERIRVKQSGEVGIGTDDPGSLLHLHGTGGTTSGLMLKNGAGKNVSLYLNNNTSSSQFSINYGGTGGSDIQIASDGNVLLAPSGFASVGIGTYVPTARLDVNVGSSVTAFNVSGSEGQLFSVTNNLSSGSIFSVNDISGSPSVDVDADGTIQLAPLLPDEKVGIGTTNPDSKLHVFGNVVVGHGNTFSPSGLGTGAGVGIVTCDVIHLRGGGFVAPRPYNGGSGNKTLVTDASIIAAENFHIYNLESDGMHLRNLIEKNTGVIAIGQANTNTISKIRLYPGNLSNGNVELYNNNDVILSTSATGTVLSGISTLADDKLTILNNGGQVQFKANIYTFNGESSGTAFRASSGNNIGFEAFYNSLKRFTTDSKGISVHNNLSGIGVTIEHNGQANFVGIVTAKSIDTNGTVKVGTGITMDATTGIITATQYSGGIYAKFRGPAGNTANINTATGTIMEWLRDDGVTMFNKGGFTNTTEYVTVPVDGLYQVTLNGRLECSNGFRSNVRFNFSQKLSPSSSAEYTESSALNNYIRVATGHNESSVNLTCFMELEAGDEIGVRTLREADSVGTVTLNRLESSITFIKVA